MIVRNSQIFPISAKQRRWSSRPTKMNIADLLLSRTAVLSAIKEVRSGTVWCEEMVVVAIIPELTRLSRGLLGERLLFLWSLRLERRPDHWMDRTSGLRGPCLEEAQAGKPSEELQEPGFLFFSLVDSQAVETKSFLFLNIFKWFLFKLSNSLFSTGIVTFDIHF